MTDSNPETNAQVVSEEVKRTEKTTRKVTFNNLDVPFDLNLIFPPVQVSVDGMRDVVEFILSNLGEQREKIHEIKERVTLKLMQVDK